MLFLRDYLEKLNICEPWKLNATSFQNIKLAPKIIKKIIEKEEENGNTIVIITEFQKFSISFAYLNQITHPHH